jgi:hypothetical protein
MMVQEIEGEDCQFGGTLLGWGLHFSKKMPLHFTQGAGMGSGSTVVVTVRHVEQSQLPHAILASRDLVRRPKALDHVPLGFHCSRCRPDQQRAPPTLAAFQHLALPSIL